MKLSENIRYMADHLSEVDSDYLKDIAASVENMEVEIPEFPDDFATLRDQFAMTALQGMTIPYCDIGRGFNESAATRSPSADATGFKLNVCYRVAPGSVRCATEDFKK